MTLPKSESQTCFQGILCGGQNTFVISIASVVSLVIFGYIRDFKITVESLMRRVYMYVLISTAFSHCYARLDENSGLGAFHLAGKVDLASKVDDVVLLKTKAFDKRLMCLFYCRTTENKRINGKIRELPEISPVIPITVIRSLREWSLIFRHLRVIRSSRFNLGIFGGPSVIFVDLKFISSIFMLNELITKTGATFSRPIR